MAIVQISKIIQKQGLYADLPQLDAAEIGYATDSKRVFIGDTLPPSPSPSTLYNTEVLTQNSVDGTSIVYDSITGKISSTGGGGGGGGSVTYVNLVGGTTGLTTVGGPITSVGTISLGGILALGAGGTGANTATGAINNLLPTQIGNSGKYLQTDGANTSWVSAFYPAGSNTQIQYNANGVFGASPNLLWQSNTLIVGNVNANAIIAAGLNQSLTISANGAITFTLPNSANNKITVAGPSASTYSNNLANTDIVNKYYVDTAISATINTAVISSANTTFLQAGTGAVTRTVQTELRETVKVTQFGAVGDGLTDDTVAIQSVIDAVYSAGGGIVYAPPGTYVVGPLTMRPKVRLVGAGQESTIFKSSHTGYGLKMLSTINSSVSVQTSVESMQFWNTNASNIDGGYVDVCGTFVNLFNVLFKGFKYGVIFDQTELATIRQCHFAANLRAGLWFVNGSEYTPGALGLFTNRIAVVECQFNEGAAAYCVIDDGGYAHSFKDNNYNGGLNSMRIAAADPITIADSEFEAAAGANIVFSNTSAGGVVVGQALNALVQSNIIVPVAGQSCISCISGPSELVLINNSLGNSAAAKITGLSLVAKFVDIGNNTLGGPFSSGTPTYQFRDQDTGAFTPAVTFGGASVGVTYSVQAGKYTRIGNVVTFAIQINLSSKGSSTGSMQITGLPYSSASGITQAANPGFATGIVGPTSIAGWITAGSTVIQLQNDQVNYSATLNDANVSNNTVMYFTGSYLTA